MEHWISWKKGARSKQPGSRVGFRLPLAQLRNQLRYLLFAGDGVDAALLAVIAPTCVLKMVEGPFSGFLSMWSPSQIRILQYEVSIWHFPCGSRRSQVTE